MRTSSLSDSCKWRWLVWQKFAFKKAKALKVHCVALSARSNKKTSLRK